MITKEIVNKIAYSVIGAAIEVHKELGPGLLESFYELCLIEELRTRGHSVKSQQAIPVFYKGREIKTYHVPDLIVDDILIVELKAVEALNPVFKAQLLTYLKLTGLPKGLLINFNCSNIVSQMVPMVTDKFAELP
ncbi:MAG: GxxExxY protein [Bacteroidia bacterium]